jgi:hypothetical protein
MKWTTKNIQEMTDQKATEIDMEDIVAEAEEIDGEEGEKEAL